MTRFLLDANLSPETAAFLTRTFGFDVDSLQTRDRGTLADAAVVAMARNEGRVIITFDQDFGEIYYLRERGQFGVVVLELADQTVEYVNASLERFFRTEASSIELAGSLVVLEEDRIRVVGPQD